MEFPNNLGVRGAKPEYAEIKCTFSGNPKPKIEWFLDGYPLSYFENMEFDIDTSASDKYDVEPDGQVYNMTSKFKIDVSKVKYGGSYTCK